MQSCPVNDGDPESDCEEAGVHGPGELVGKIYFGEIVIWNKLNSITVLKTTYLLTVTTLDWFEISQFYLVTSFENNLLINSYNFKLIWNELD